MAWLCVDLRAGRHLLAGKLLDTDVERVGSTDTTAVAFDRNRSVLDWLHGLGDRPDPTGSIEHLFGLRSPAVLGQSSSWICCFRNRMRCQYGRVAICKLEVAARLD